MVAFLPVSRSDMAERGWEWCDFIFVSGDAYVDHPSFAGAVITRVLEDAGFRVGMIAQPDWRRPASYAIMGRPRLGFMVGSGNMDSMVAHYTAARKPRSTDSYSPGGAAGLRPDRALLHYVAGIRTVYKNIPVIIGGLEASLRRFAHYDYWSDTVRRSVLLDSKADILVYGMGEGPVRELARRLAAGEPVTAIKDVPGTCVRVDEPPQDSVRLPDYELVRGSDADSLSRYASHFMLQKANASPVSAKRLCEQSDGRRFVVQNPPALPLDTQELDHIYELPYTRHAHPMYQAAGGVPALTEVSFSLTANRGCFGGCSFCAITFHQGHAVTSRSRESLVAEARHLATQPEFKGYIHDIGGPTANFYGAGCLRHQQGSFCTERECLFPRPCPQLKADHRRYLSTLAAVRAVRGIKKVFIRSGIRFDFIELDQQYGGEFLETICTHHISGQLKVAPEHISAPVLSAMGKGEPSCYERFCRQYAVINRRLGLKQYLVPYFLLSHPGTTPEDAHALARYLKASRFIPEQVQDFYPTPGTLSTVMYHTGIDPRSMQPVFVPRGERARRMQRELLSRRP
jgi:uncharacterized radical SAM protein YgiQ